MLLLREKGYFIVKYKNEHLFKQFFLKKVNNEDLGLLCSSLSLLLDSGVSISEALKLCKSQQGKTKLIESLENIRVRVLQGESLYDAMNNFKSIYPDFLLKMVYLGEESGTLQFILRELSDYYEKQNEIGKKITTSLAYPIIVLITSILCISFLMIKVIPQFLNTLTDLGGELPLMTKVFLFFCTFLRKNIIFILIFSIILISFLVYIIKKRNAQIFIDKFKLKIPMVNLLFSKIIMCRFSRAMSLLLSSGLPVTNCLETVSEILENKFIEGKLKESLIDINEGKSIYFALKKCQVFNPIFLSIINVGEESGRLEEILKKLAEISENDLQENMQKLVKFIEPAVILFLSAFIGLMIMSILLPIFNIIDVLG
jgi:type IV pilus assembly protein PilC